MDRRWIVTAGEGPVVATAIHAGHGVDAWVQPYMAADGETRLREEDPYTDGWVGIAPSQVVVDLSRFQVDMNRPESTCVYRTLRESWGVEVWQEGGPPASVVEAGREMHRQFYGDVERMVRALLERHGAIVVLDLHSYCHRRGGPDADEDDPELNPQINVGTASVGVRHGHLVWRFLRELGSFDLGGRRLDVRENVKFMGGHFPRWLNGSFDGRVCALAIEVKKFFMDEWTGKLDRKLHGLIGEALASTVHGLGREIGRV